MPVEDIAKSNTSIKWSEGEDIYLTLSTKILRPKSPIKPTTINMDPYLPNG